MRPQAPPVGRLMAHRPHPAPRISTSVSSNVVGTLERGVGRQVGEGGMDGRMRGSEATSSSLPGQNFLSTRETVKTRPTRPILSKRLNSPSDEIPVCHNCIGSLSRIARRSQCRAPRSWPPISRSPGPKQQSSWRSATSHGCKAQAWKAAGLLLGSLIEGKRAAWLLMLGLAGISI